MKLLIVISNPASSAALGGLVGACLRRELPFLCFFTGDGVALLDDPDLHTGLSRAERAVVCEYSWRRYAPDRAAAFEEGSQTDHSAMIGEASHVVSL